MQQIYYKCCQYFNIRKDLKIILSNYYSDTYRNKNVIAWVSENRFPIKTPQFNSFLYAA